MKNLKNAWFTRLYEKNFIKSLFIALIVGLLALCFSSGAAIADAPHYQSELIFPVEPWHNHGSSLVECPDGSLLACWFHGSGERTADDVLVQGARKAKGSSQWGERFVMADTPGYPDCNPVLFIDADGRLWLYWITVLANLWESSLLKYRTSSRFIQPNGPPEWDWQDNIHITPQHFTDDLKAEWDDFVQKYPNLIPDPEKPFSELHGDEFTAYHMRNVNNRLQQRIGWMTRIHPLQLPSGKLLLPLYTDAFSISIIAITEDG
ncbi:MAG: exo-alpha-sialidase, partial [Candidatus Omnitrophica bacterium]|nr:exo-alpha-sialidase [Candidatus Omnitrophota bacterium]